METTRLPVFFSRSMVADARSFSPSASKPARVVEAWQARGLPIALHEPVPVTVEQLALAHDAAHVRAVLACEAPNGFGTRSPEVAASLPYTTGAMLSAARYALSRRTFACAPCSGFHHAGYAHVEGYCTFNGLMVTACVLRSEGLARRVGILDCDMHYGDGTDEILARLGAHAWVRHYTAGGEYSRPEESERFLERLPELAGAMADCDVVLYQAGADPHVDDPLGGWLTTAQLRRRDACVFETFARLGVPVVWNLAGGYQQEPDGSIPRVLALHENTALECLRVLGARASPSRKPQRPAL